MTNCSNVKICEIIFENLCAAFKFGLCMCVMHMCVIYMYVIFMCVIYIYNCICIDMYILMFNSLYSQTLISYFHFEKVQYSSNSTT